MTITIKRSKYEPVKLIFAGLILFFISTFTNHHLFYLYYYLFIVGALICLKAFSPFILLNEGGIKFNYGIFNNKELFIDWTNVINAFYTTELEAISSSYGAHLAIPASRTKKISCLKIELSKGINQTSQKSISKYSNEFKYCSETNTLTIITEPQQGFQKLIKGLKQYREVEVRSGFDSTLIKLWKMLKSFLIFMMQLAFFIGCLFILFIMIFNWTGFFHY